MPLKPSTGAAFVLIPLGALTFWGGLSGYLPAILAAMFARGELVRQSGLTGIDLPPPLLLPAEGVPVEGQSQLPQGSQAENPIDGDPFEELPTSVYEAGYGNIPLAPPSSEITSGTYPGELSSGGSTPQLGSGSSSKPSGSNETTIEKDLTDLGDILKDTIP